VQLEYLDFIGVVRRVAEEQGPAGLVPIGDLRREVPDVSRETYHRHLLRLRDENLVHLLSHVDPSILSDAERAECMRDDEQVLIYWVRWLGSAKSDTPAT
jgi:hypothetical protein